MHISKYIYREDTLHYIMRVYIYYRWEPPYAMRASATRALTCASADPRRHRRLIGIAQTAACLLGAEAREAKKSSGALKISIEKPVGVL